MDQSQNLLKFYQKTFISAYQLIRDGLLLMGIDMLYNGNYLPNTYLILEKRFGLDKFLTQIGFQKIRDNRLIQNLGQFQYLDGQSKDHKTQVRIIKENYNDLLYQLPQQKKIIIIHFFDPTQDLIQPQNVLFDNFDNTHQEQQQQNKKQKMNMQEEQEEEENQDEQTDDEENRFEEPPLQKKPKQEYDNQQDQNENQQKEKKQQEKQPQEQDNYQILNEEIKQLKGFISIMNLNMHQLGEQNKSIILENHTIKQQILQLKEKDNEQDQLLIDYQKYKLFLQKKEFGNEQFEKKPN